MTIDDIPLLSLEILKHNIPDYDTLTDDRILEYFNTKYDVFSLPQLPDEEKGLAILKDTIIKDELIIIATDYDCDGLSGAAIGRKALKNKCSNYKVIHNKRVNGNGFTKPFMETIKKIHAKTPISLLISVDHGSNNVEAVDEMHSIGIKKVIITDHHSISGEGVVNADAFITPQRGCPELIGMCGAYVVFKLLSGLYRDDKDIFNTLYRPCLPHVAIATVADVMSLSLDYNRLVVRAGLQLINTDTKLWKILGDKLNIPEVYSYKDIGFVLAPFINTGNRASVEELIYNILNEDDSEMLAYLIDQGSEVNKKRKKIKKEVMVNVLRNIPDGSVNNTISLIVDTSMAINGIIASSLGSIYNVPVTCFILNKDTGILSGSSRANVDHVSIVDTYNEIHKLDPTILIGSGGHRGAGGCAIKFDKLDVFRDRFEEVVSKIPVPTDVSKEEFIIDISTKYLNYGIVEEINYAGPYGKDWELPKLSGKFKLKSMLFIGSMIIMSMIALNGRVFKCTYFYKEGESRDSIGNRLANDMVVTAVFEPQYYKRYGKLSFTLLVHDIFGV